MKTHFKHVSMLGLAVTIAALAAFVAPAGDDDKEMMTQAKLGEKAPAFELKDLKGNAHKSEALMKDKITVLQWVNPDCPICKRVHKSGRVEATLDELKKHDDVTFIAINSTHYMDADRNKKALGDYGLDYTLLIDQDGTVGHLYGAKTTPHVYVIDKKNVLRYHGAFDNDPDGSKTRDGEDVTNYVVSAITQIKANETVTPDFVKPYGCSVKYATK